MELHLFFEWDDEGPSLMSVLSACPRLTHLIYYTSDANGLFGNDIHPLAPCALTHLRLNCSQKYIIENAELGAILSRCEQLQYLDVKPCDPSALDIIQRRCQHLEYLRCNSIVNPNSNHWNSIPRTEQGDGLQLRLFSMTGYGNMTARNVMPILSESKETLEELCLIDDRQYGRQHTTWWDPLVDFASSRLRALEFSIDHHTHVLPSIIRQCPALQTVNIVQFASNDVFESLLTLSDLRHLSLSGNCNRMTESGLMEFLNAVSASSSLRKIEFSGLERVVTDTSILLLANICRLQELKLGFCRSLTGQGMDAFLWKMKHNTLECLTLALMDSLTDSGLDWLGKLTHINKIKLEMCNNVTDTGIQHLMEDLGSKLKFLRVHLCDEVSTEMANIVEKRFPLQRNYDV
ncbi:hypothetical protein BJV82DRAFT_170661 [Fennellomyces sp. T-0311]|nr:hypothetical protein BJV82DRAFT_170661 [Fennellomyces sp. T-0311]